MVTMLFWQAIILLIALVVLGSATLFYRGIRHYRAASFIQLVSLFSQSPDRAGLIAAELVKYGHNPKEVIRALEISFLAAANHDKDKAAEAMARQMQLADFTDTTKIKSWQKHARQLFG